MMYGESPDAWGVVRGAGWASPLGEKGPRAPYEGPGGWGPTPGPPALLGGSHAPRQGHPINMLCTLMSSPSSPCTRTMGLRLFVPVGSLSNMGSRKQDVSACRVSESVVGAFGLGLPLVASCFYASTCMCSVVFVIIVVC